MTAARSIPGRLGSYEVLDRLATGGMAEVYLARCHGLEGFEKLVVLKRLKPEFADSAEYVNMFLDEARLMAFLRHTNIPEVHEISSVEGTYFMAMEFLHGKDVRSILSRARARERPIPLGVAITIVSRALSGLHYAHERTQADGSPLEIVHRDVSPANIFVTFEGGVSILDFGIAKTAAQSLQTQVGVLKGKIRYMSPEQCSASPVDRRSDIFACGTVLWELTTGHGLHEKGSDLETLRQIVREDAPAPSSLVPDYPPALEAIVTRALSRHVDDRYQTAREMQVELEAFATEQRLASTSLALAEWVRDLFREEITAWTAAQRAGKGLAEHLVEARQVSPRDSFAPAPTPSGRATPGGMVALAIPPQPPRPWNGAIVALVAGFLAVGAITLLALAIRRAGAPRGPEVPALVGAAARPSTERSSPSSATLQAASPAPSASPHVLTPIATEIREAGALPPVVRVAAPTASRPDPAPRAAPNAPPPSAPTDAPTPPPPTATSTASATRAWDTDSSRLPP